MTLLRKNRKNLYAYCIVAGRYTIEGVEHTGYGMSVELQDSGVPFMRYEDLTSSYEKMAKFVEWCNQEQIEPMQMPYLVEDLLS